MLRRLKTRLRAPYGALLGLLTRWSGRRVGLALVYHAVGDPQQDTARYLVAKLGTELFEEQLRQLKPRYMLVPASELLDATRARRRGQKIPVAITFDDDLPSHVRVALPILRQVGVPATFFLSGRSLEAPFAFWWERLQMALEGDLVSEDELMTELGLAASTTGRGGIRGIAATIEAMPREDRELLTERLLRRIGSDPADAGMRAEDVRALVADGFEIGFHTRGHDALPQLSDEELEAAMTGGRSELEEAGGGGVSVISYPHGKADPRVAAAARASGYRFGFTTTAEPVRPQSDPLLMGRAYPSYDSAGRFSVEVARLLRRA